VLRSGEKEWQQFHFQKRIEWQPTAAQEPQKEAEYASAVVEDVTETEPILSPRTRSDRAYSLSAVDDLKQSLENGTAELVAPREAIEAATKESATEAEVKTADARTPVEPALQSPITLTDSFSLSEGTVDTALSEADSYAAQLTTLANQHHYAEIPAVFEQMLSSGISPTPTAYNALLAAAVHGPWAKHQIVPKAKDVYADMLRRRVLPDTAFYATLIELLSTRALKVSSMKQVLEDKRTRYGGMEEDGKFMFQSNETESQILAEDAALNDAVKLFDASIAINSNRAFSEKTYRRIITACAEGGKVDDMVRIYTHMESQDVIPRAEMFVPMIHAFGACGNLRSAVECYDEYKALAVAHDAGKISVVRKDEEVYAALIKAYIICGKGEGGQKFLAKIEAGVTDSDKMSALHDTVALRALLPEWLKKGSLDEAFQHAKEKLSARVRDVGLAAVCIRAADRNNIEVATKAFDSLSDKFDVSIPAMAMGAMHIRSANLEAAEAFWGIIERDNVTIEFLESTVMHTVALIGSGRPELGLARSRVMFARIRDSAAESKHSKLEAVEQIDEAVEVIGHFMAKKGIMLPAKAGMELLWTMIENGGLVTPVAGHVLAGMGPEDIAQLDWDDLKLLVQVQASIIINGAGIDVGHMARFGYLIEVITGSGMMVDSRTVNMIEKVLPRLGRPDLEQKWQSYLYPVPEPVYTPAQFGTVPHTPAQQPMAFEDSYDPYAATTDNKGSVAITDLLEKTHGKSANHLNEALIKFKNMRRAGRHPRFFTYAKLITAAAKENRLELAHDILALAKQDVPFLPQYRIVRYGWVTILDAMVAACLTTGRRDLASKFHQDLLDMGAAPSANTFGLYITTLKESTKTFDEATEAVKIFLRAKTEGVEPSSFLYNALIGKLGKARRIDDCLFYFAEMRNLGIRPTSVTYGTIVNALCRVSDEKFAEELFEEMESMPNYKPRPAPYHSLMQFLLTTKRDRTKALAYYDRMRARGIQPTTHTYKLLIDAYATLEPVDMSAAEQVLEQIPQPEAVHYAALIHAKGCVQHDMRSARALFDTVLADRRIAPAACLFQSLFEAMVANHQIAETQPILDLMRARGVQMTPYIANSLIHGWALAGDIRRARKVYESVEEQRREPSTYEAMTRACVALEDREGAMAVVNEALSRGYPAAVANKILELVGGGRAQSVVGEAATA